MTPRLRLAAFTLTAGSCLTGCSARLAESPIVPPPALVAVRPAADRQGLAADLDRIFDSPALARALIGVRVTSLADGRILYDRDAKSRVVPASNLKLLTVAVAAERLGWDFRYETRLEMAGAIDQGTLRGDLIVRGEGDPSIDSHGADLAPLFLEWADVLARAGIQRVAGRLIGDDDAFDDLGLGAGWAWDYLAAGYAARSGALTYDENTITLRLSPGPTAGSAAGLDVTPKGHQLEIINETSTGAQASDVMVNLLRAPDSSRLTVRGSIPLSGQTVVRTAAVVNPTRYFVEALRLALAERGITIAGGAWDIDDLSSALPPAVGRRTLARRESAPLSSLAAYALKVSQNVYGETFLKTLGRPSSGPGTTAAGRDVVVETIAAWGVPAESVVMVDGSGLSRYNYVTAEAIAAVLTHVWKDERLRGPFVAALPVGGRDGTLELRMRNSVLDRRVQAKTGALSNVRALSGYAQTASGEKLAFSMIANHFTVPTAEIDALMEQALERLVRDQ